MRYADILVIAHKVKTWGGKGGRKHDAYLAEIKNRMLEEEITEEEAAADMEDLKGKDRHEYNRLNDSKVVASQLGRSVKVANRDELYDRLIPLIAQGDPFFDVNSWAHEVNAAFGSKDNKGSSKAAFRLETFKVQGTGPYREIAKALKDPLLLPKFPPEPPRGSDKSKWRTACTEVKVTRLSEAGMVNTYIYHRWLENYLKDPDFKMGS